MQQLPTYPRSRNLPSEDKYPHLLGLNLKRLRNVLGEPYASYALRGHEIYMFVGTNEHIDCEVRNGLVVRVDAHTERRSAARIKPLEHMAVLLRHETANYHAEVVDLSVKSIAIRILDGGMPPDGDLITFCTSLRTSKKTITHIVLKGHILRTIPDENKAILVLDTVNTHSYQALTDFVEKWLALTPLGIEVDQMPAPDSHDADKTIKSDLCQLCDESTCALESFLDSTPNHWSAVQNA